MTWTRRIGALLILAGVAATPAVAWRSRCPMSGSSGTPMADTRISEANGRTGIGVELEVMHRHRARVVRVAAGVPGHGWSSLAGGPFPGRVNSITAFRRSPTQGKYLPMLFSKSKPPRRPPPSSPTTGRSSSCAASRRPTSTARPRPSCCATSRFDIKEGDFVSIMGPSGAGKSTLLAHPRHARHRRGPANTGSSGDAGARAGREGARRGCTRSTSASCSRAITCSTT